MQPVADLPALRCAILYLKAYENPFCAMRCMFACSEVLYVDLPTYLGLRFECLLCLGFACKFDLSLA